MGTPESVFERADNFRHEVAFYEDDDSYLAAAIPFLRAGIEADEATMVALGPAKTALVQGALGDEAEAIRFENIEQLGRNPARLVPAWREYADEQPAETAVRGLGEPVWPGRDAAEIDECHRHEALLNHALEPGLPISLLCPYDSRALPDEVLQEALCTHPHVAGRGGDVLPSPSWEDGRPDPFAGELDARPRRRRRVPLRPRRPARAARASSPALRRTPGSPTSAPKT